VWKGKQDGIAKSPLVIFGAIGCPCRLQELIDLLEQRLDAGEKLYVHCWGGRGRAGTVGACLLSKRYNIAAEEALQRVQQSFDTRQDGGKLLCLHVGLCSQCVPVWWACNHQDPPSDLFICHCAGRLSPETAEQRQFVIDYVNSL
jgi:hypothetical protein